MLTENPILDDVEIRRRMSEIQSRWSPSERLQRAQEGQRRREQLMSLVAGIRFEPEIWAVGAPVPEDCGRIAV